MTAQANRQFRLKQRPTGRAKATDFDFVEAPFPTAGAGEAIVEQTLYPSIDPTNRIWMSDMEQYMPPVAIGEVMRGGGMGRVVASNSGHWQVGDIVGGLLGWQEYCLVRERTCSPRASYLRISQSRSPQCSAHVALRASGRISGFSIFANRSRVRQSWCQRPPGRSVLLRGKSPRSRAAVQ